MCFMDHGAWSIFHGPCVSERAAKQLVVWGLWEGAVCIPVLSLGWCALLLAGLHLRLTQPCGEDHVALARLDDFFYFFLAT